MNRAKRKAGVEKMISAIGDRKTTFRRSSSVDDLLKIKPSPCWAVRGYSTPTSIGLAFGVLPLPRLCEVTEVRPVDDGWLVTAPEGFFFLEQALPGFELSLERWGGSAELSEAFQGVRALIEGVPLAVEIKP